MLNSFVYSTYDENTESWEINRNGFVFKCTYIPGDDWVEVYCPEISSVPQGAEAKKMDYHRIADFLASEILRYAA
ncbi:MAG: hypothetical protein D6B28_04555 [Gammaproteobacteria bacterium]|nr:MAG: hypothetical protein D6B28_04555 [Gammaproteobacteria bacterium]